MKDSVVAERGPWHFGRHVFIPGMQRFGRSRHREHKDELSQDPGVNVLPPRHPAELAQQAVYPRQAQPSHL